MGEPSSKGGGEAALAPERAELVAALEAEVDAGNWRPSSPRRKRASRPFIATCRTYQAVR
jgi:hypothetical protein